MYNYPTMVVKSGVDIDKIALDCADFIIDQYTQYNNRRDIPTYGSKMAPKRHILYHEIHKAISSTM